MTTTSMRIRPPRTLVQRLTAATLVAAACMCLGCGTGGYEERLNVSVEQLKGGSAGVQLLYGDPLKLGETPISIQLPKAFQTVFGENPQVDGTTVDGCRIKIPLGSLPGYLFTYEATVVDSTGGKLPYYIEVGVETARDNGKDPGRPLLNAFRTDAWRDATEPWADVQCAGPSGEAKTWRRLRTAGRQKFYYVGPDGQGEVQSMDGLIEVYLITENGYNIFIAWRMPTSIKGLVGTPPGGTDTPGLDKLAQLVGGSLKSQ